jgi:hypothetical protein
MTIEKLQKIAIAHVEPKYKAKWLRWWNASENARQSYRFLGPKEKEAQWDPWIHKASFWAEVKTLSILFSSIVFQLF